jgi:hypothetical protein
MLLHRCLRSYDKALARHRLATSTVSGSLLAFAGDYLVQASTQAEGGDFDAPRSLSFVLLGGVMTGPINYVWLGALERAVHVLAPMGGYRALACKMTLQSFVLQPFICK